MRALPLIFCSIASVRCAEWTEFHYEILEQALLSVADEYFPMDHSLAKRSTTCPGGNGKFGFNSYSLLTAVILGFTAVSNVIDNVNNNLNNNNNNNNQNDVGSIQGTSQDVDLMSTSMTMIITIVPPVGPPIPVLVGRALQPTPNATFDIYLAEQFNKDGVYFELEDSTMVFPNGTLIYSNGTVTQGQVYFGAVDSKNQREMKKLSDILNVDHLTLEDLRYMNQIRQAKSGLVNKAIF